MSNTVRKVPATMTADEFLAWPGDGMGGRYQLVDGALRAKSPASTTHGAIQANVGGLLRQHLAVPGNPCRVVAEPAVSVRIRANINTRVPDLGVTCAKDAQGQIYLPDPLLLVEIVSPGNATDTWDNVWAYTTLPSVQEILVLQSTRIEAQVVRRDPDGSWAATPVIVADGAKLVLRSIDLEFPLREAYGKTYLVE